MTEHEDTRQLPPFETDRPTAPAPARRARGLSSAVLAGALVLGGAAGVGGAAWYDAWQGDDTPAAAPATTGGGEIAASSASAPAGTVEEVAQKVLPSVVKIEVSGQSGAGSGSGIVISKDGKILTNNHVVSLAGGGGTIIVARNDGTTRKATILGTDPVTDLAVIKTEGAGDWVPATLGKSGALKVGQPVVAVGSPYGLNATVTTGIVSALDRAVSVQTSDQPQQQDPGQMFGFPQQQPQSQAQDLSTTYPAIQTDAAINPGNSGGPLVDMSSRVVGINSSIRTSDSSGFSSSSGGSIGLGFAIPIDEVLPIVNQLIAGQTPTHAKLAVTVSDATGEGTQGAQLRSVESGGPAAKAGLRQGDVITKVDGSVVDGSESLVATIRGHRPGDQVELTYLRGGSSHTLTVTLGSDKGSSRS